MNIPTTISGEVAPRPVARVGAVAGRARTCLVCDVDVRLHVSSTAGAEAVCESPDCRVILSRREHLGPHAFRFLIENHRRLRREQQQLAVRSVREAREHEAIREAVNRHERLPESGYPLVVLPATPTVLSKPSQERRQRYEDHLARIIAEALAVEEGSATVARETSDAPDPMPLAEQLCALCRGGCCSMGGEKAFLRAATIRRFMRLRPELSPDRVLAEYLGRLGDQTVAGSCIHHTSTGCSLPREMRADTCNDYFCRSMRSWQARCTSGEPPLGALVVQRGRDNWTQDRTDVAHDVAGISVVTERGARPPARAALRPAPPPAQ